MKKLLIKSINRIDRANTSSDTFKIQLFKPIIGKYLLESCKINNSLYTINNNNNKLYFSDTSTLDYYVATLTNGTYESALLANELQTQLNDSSPQTYTVTYSTLTSKFTIACDVNCDILLESFPSTSYATCGTVIGFSDIDITGVSSATSDKMANFIPTTSLTISINESSNDISYGNIYVQLSDSHGYYINIDKNDHPQYFIFNTECNFFEINITDANNKPVDLNGIDWEMLIKKII